MSCCKQRLVISEQEKKGILELYGLINEQEEKKFQIFGNSFFGDGKWMELNPTTKSALDTQIKQAIEFLSKNKGQIGSIQITASESQVPNADREKNSKEYGKALKVYELSRRRADTMKKYMTTQFQNALNNGVISQMPVFKEPTLLRGETPYDSKNPNNPKHNEERYVKVDVSLQGKPEVKKTYDEVNKGCARNMKMRIYTDPTIHGDHNCNSSVFEVYINGVLINRDGDKMPYVSLNNAGLMDNAGYVIQKKELPFKTPKNKTIYKPVYYPMSKSPGTKRENFITISDDLFKRIPNIDKEIVITFRCKNISKWIPTPNDLSKYFPEIQDVSQWFTVNTSNGTLYQGTQLTYVGNQWYHATNWGYGCHKSVGAIDITNNEGKTITIPLKTPMGKDEDAVYTAIDPCSLNYKTQ
jgi:hypothetical protein